MDLVSERIGQEHCSRWMVFCSRLYVLRIHYSNAQQRAGIKYSHRKCFLQLINAHFQLIGCMLNRNCDVALLTPVTLTVLKSLGAKVHYKLSYYVTR